MSYQELVVTKAVKAGFMNTIPVTDGTYVNANGDAWVHGTHIQGLKYPNDGKTFLIASNMKVITADTDEATWSPTAPHEGVYSALLDKPVTATDSSTHVQFSPTTKLTLQDFLDAIDDAVAGGALVPEWSFWHKCENAITGNFVQFEFRFEDPASDAWLEVTTFPLQGYTGTGGWLQAILQATTGRIFGGHTPDGTGAAIFVTGPLSGLEAAVEGEWEAHELGTGAATANYILDRIRLELWEQDAARTAYVDDVQIDGEDYDIEPGMAGGQLSKPEPIVTLNFVAPKDSYGRTETLAPIVGAEQSLMVGPLLPAIFNDSDGYVKFQPSLTDYHVSYRVIRVDNAS